jgi:hypothetical protein
MTSRHAHRDHAGKFTQSPAPQDADADVPGDPQAGPDSLDLPGDPEHREHDPRFGPLQHLIPHRRHALIDNETGAVVSEHITDVRAARLRPGGRTRVVELSPAPAGTHTQLHTPSGVMRKPGTRSEGTTYDLYGDD